MWEPLVADWDARVRASFARQGLMRTLGAQVHALEPGRCTLTVPYTDGVGQQHGFFHAGTTSALADTACGYAAYTLFAADVEVLTAEFKINLLAPAAGTRLWVDAEVVRRGKRLTTTLAYVDVERDGGRKRCAIMLATVVPSA